MRDLNGSLGVGDVQLIAPLKGILLGVPLSGGEGEGFALHCGDVDLQREKPQPKVPRSHPLQPLSCLSSSTAMLLLNMYSASRTEWNRNMSCSKFLPFQQIDFVNTSRICAPLTRSTKMRAEKGLRSHLLRTLERSGWTGRDKVRQRGSLPKCAGEKHQ